MLPSVSVNHAALPALLVAMPFSVFSPGKSYSSKTTPRPRSSSTSRSRLSVSQLSCVFFAVPALSVRYSRNDVPFPQR